MGYSASLIFKFKDKVNNTDVIEPHQIQIGRGHIAEFIYPNVSQFQSTFSEDLGFSLEEIYQNLTAKEKSGLPSFQYGEFHVFYDDEEFDELVLVTIEPIDMLKTINKSFFLTKKKLKDDIKVGLERLYSYTWTRINALQEITEFYTSLRLLLEIAKDNNLWVEITFEGSP